jgi:hypothetical protein
LFCAIGAATEEEATCPADGAPVAACAVVLLLLLRLLANIVSSSSDVMQNCVTTHTELIDFMVPMVKELL